MIRSIGLSWVAVCALAVAAAGCSSYGSYCTDEMDCEGGNDADVEACEIRLDLEAEKASIRGCPDEWDAYFTCAEEESKCTNDQWTPGKRCDNEKKRLDDCLH